MATYILRTRAGTFSIEPDEAALHLFKLCVGGLWLASFETVEHAAEAISRRETGWPDWDRAKDEDCPSGLEVWEKC